MTTPPKSIYVEPTNLCNRKCSFCFHANNAMKRKKGVMTFKTFKKVVDDVKSFKPELVLHHSGESFLHKELFKFIKYAKKNGLAVGITTNGTLLDKDGFGILDTDIDVINVSLAGIDAEDYSRVRSAEEFDQVMEDVRSLAAEKMERGSTARIFVNVTETRHNKKKIKAFRKRVESIDGVDGVIVRRLMDWNGNVDIKGLTLPNRWLFMKIRNVYKRARLWKDGTLCDAVFKSSAVLWDGTVVPCCLDFNATIPLGNINKHSFLEIWDGERANTLRDMLRSTAKTKKHPTCGQCVFQA